MFHRNECIFVGFDQILHNFIVSPLSFFDRFAPLSLANPNVDKDEQLLVMRLFEILYPFLIAFANTQINEGSSLVQTSEKV